MKKIAASALIPGDMFFSDSTHGTIYVVLRTHVGESKTTITCHVDFGRPYGEHIYPNLADVSLVGHIDLSL